MYIHLQSKKSSGIAKATIELLAISRLCGRVVHSQFPLLHDNLYKADCCVPVQTSRHWNLLAVAEVNNVIVTLRSRQPMLIDEALEMFVIYFWKVPIK